MLWLRVSVRVRHYCHWVLVRVKGYGFLGLGRFRDILWLGLDLGLVVRFSVRVRLRVSVITGLELWLVVRVIG